MLEFLRSAKNNLGRIFVFGALAIICGLGMYYGGAFAFVIGVAYSLTAAFLAGVFSGFHNAEGNLKSHDFYQYMAKANVLAGFFLIWVFVWSVSNYSTEFEVMLAALLLATLGGFMLHWVYQVSNALFYGDFRDIQKTNE